MICKHWVDFSKDIENVEGYEEALKSNRKYVVHHRLETHFSDGTPRPKNAYLTSTELKALGMYYNRPAEELIIMSTSQHRQIHNLDERRLCKMKETMHRPGYTNSGMFKKGVCYRRDNLTCEQKKKISESVHKNPEAMGRKVKAMREAFKNDNKGLSWNEFQHKYKGEF